MSMFKVPVTKILNITDHPNADRLSVITVFGFQVIAPKGRYQVGEKVIYVPVDSVLSEELEAKIFPPDSKVKLTKRRIRQIRLRGLASQGMLIAPGEFTQGNEPVDTDMAPVLGITKYEPPQRQLSTTPGKPGQPRPKENIYFGKYGGLDNIKWYPAKFKPDEQIVLQEKIHGTNARAAILPYTANTLWKKLKLFLGLAPATEFCYGSNNVQLQNKVLKNGGYYGQDVYGSVFSKLDVKNKLKSGETIYGEIYGEGIQKNYSYGTKEHKFILFDVKVMQADGTHKWLSPDEVKQFGQERGFEVVPELYRGPFQSLEFVKTHTLGNSVLAPSQKVREGVVVKSLENYDESGNNRALKVISEDYLDDKSNTDFH